MKTSANKFPIYVSGRKVTRIWTGMATMWRSHAQCMLHHQLRWVEKSKGEKDCEREMSILCQLTNSKICDREISGELVQKWTSSPRANNWQISERVSIIFWQVSWYRNGPAHLEQIFGREISILYSSGELVQKRRASAGWQDGGSDQRQQTQPASATGWYYWLTKSTFSWTMSPSHCYIGLCL